MEKKEEKQIKQEITEDSQNAGIKEKRKASYLILYKLTTTFISVLMMFCIILFLFYIAGNFQAFTNKTQLLILNLLTLSAVAMCIMTLIGMIVNFIFIFMQKSLLKRILPFLSMILVFIVGIIFIVFSFIIVEISKGVNI